LLARVSRPGNDGRKREGSEALAGFVGPFELDGVAAEGASLPGADVADFAVVIVVPTLAGDGVGNGFAEFVGRGGGERVEVRESAEAPCTAGIRHDGVEDAVVDGVVIAAEHFAGSAASLDDLHARRKKNEIEHVGSGGRERAGGDLRLDHLLNCGVLHGFAWGGGDESVGSDKQAVADFLAGDAVFAELVEELAAEDEIEKLVGAREQIALGRLLPRRTPENREDLNGGEQRAVAIGQVRSDLRGGCASGSRMQRDDADGVAMFSRRRAFGARFGRHPWLLVYALRAIDASAGR
jgi:hypothetical protein